MAITMKMNAMNQVPEGEKLFEAGVEANGVFVVLKGKGRLVGSNVGVPVVSGDFLGVWDLYDGCYGADCIATEEMTVFAFSVKASGDLLTILEGNKEYSGRLTASLGRFLSELYVRRGRYLQESKVLPEVVAELYRQYCARCKAEEIRAAELPNAGKDAPPVSEDPAWLEYYLET
ncbi:MAG: cyclic nucleotide-binding domain-containing protein, partial [Lachnospiraceae bacterium]|nr:cyclic nucleotide-binding domain-containing protein [Lachnospiraceae bacterium]